MISRKFLQMLGVGLLLASCDKEQKLPPDNESPSEFAVYWSKALDSNYYPHEGMPLQWAPEYIAYYADQTTDHGFVKFRNPETGALIGIWDDFLPSFNYRGYDMRTAQTENGDLILSDNTNAAVYRVAPPKNGVPPSTVWSHYFPSGFIRDPFMLYEEELFFAVEYYAPGNRYRAALLRSTAGAPVFDTVFYREALPGWEYSLVNPMVCRNSDGDRLLVAKKSELGTGEFRLGLVAYNLDRGQIEWEVDSLESGTTSFGGIVTPMLADGDTLFALGQDKVFALSVDNGARFWTYQSTFSDVHFTQGSLLVWADKVYAKTFGPQLICLKKSDGTQRWIATVGETQGQPIVDFGNYIYHGREGLFAVHKQSGYVKHWIPPQGWRTFYQNPVFDPSTGKMYVASATLLHCVQSVP